MISGYQKHAQAGSLIRFAGLWSLGPFLFFSASSGRLGTYILPCFPPLAILIGIGLNRYLAAPTRTLFSAGAVTSGAVALAGTAFLLIHELGNPPSVRWYGDGELWKWIVASITLALWGSLCFFSAARARNTAGIWLFWSAPVLFMFSVNFIIPAKSVDHRAPGTFIMAHAKEIPPEAQVFSNAGLGNLLNVPDRTGEVVVVMGKNHFAQLIEAQPTTRPLPPPQIQSESPDFVLARFGPAP